MGRHSGGGGGGMGGGGGGMGNFCFIYPDAPATPGLVTPDVTFNRNVFMNGTLNFDDGNSTTIWGFNDGGGMGGGMGQGMGGDMGGMGTLPSAAMRLNQGQVAHTVLNVGMMMTHTIHHHGIEPSMENDGVGHLSFDVQGQYTYQWRPAHAGTYFYHCHTNTVLHAEMGMYGALIVDPPSGPGTLFEGGPSYDVEAIWACDEIDTSWHTLDQGAGTCGADVGLNQLEPDYFIISGVDGANSALTDPNVAVTVNRNDRLLVRYINAGYLPQRITFGGLTAEVHMSDGRPLPNSVNMQSIDTVSAERYDCIIQPSQTGTYTVLVEYFDWVTGNVVGTARTRINVV